MSGSGQAESKAGEMTLELAQHLDSFLKKKPEYGQRDMTGADDIPF